MSSIELFKFCKYFKIYPVRDKLICIRTLLFIFDNSCILNRSLQDMINLDILRRVLTKDSVFWPITLAKHQNSEQTQNSGNESTLFFSFHEFQKALEIIVAQHLKEQYKTNNQGQLGTYRPGKEELGKEVDRLGARIVSNFNKAKSKGFFKMNPPVQGISQTQRKPVENPDHQQLFNIKASNFKRKSCFSPIIEGSGQQSPVNQPQRMQTVVYDTQEASSFGDSMNQYSVKHNFPKNKFAKNVPQQFKTIQNEDEASYNDNESESGVRQQLNASQGSKKTGDSRRRNSRRNNPVKKKNQMYSTQFNHPENVFNVYFQLNTSGSGTNGLVNNSFLQPAVKNYLASLAKASQQFKKTITSTISDRNESNQRGEGS